MINNKNPLSIYKNSDLMLRWEMISEQTGIKIQTLLSIASKDEDSIGKINLSTSEILKRKLGIDLGKFYKN